MKCLARRRCGLLLVLALALGGAEAATYYVSPSGSDGGEGMLAAPFRTVSRAAARMGAGDTCYLRAGIYRETVRPARSGTEAAPIVFAAYPGEEAEVTGLDLLPTEGWTVHSGSIFRLACARRVTDLFVDGRHMSRARYPAETASPYDTSVWMPMTVGVPSQGVCAAIFSDPDPHRAAAAWAGATVVFLPDNPAWVAYCGRVASSGPGGFSADSLSGEWKYGKATVGPGRGYFTDTLAALQAAGQWYDDGVAGTLYLWAPGGASPALGTVEGRVRDVAFDLHALDYVQVRGIAVRAAKLNLRDSRHCLVQGCSVRFAAPFARFKQGFNRDNELAPDEWEYTGVEVSGSGNIVDGCYVAETFGDGISVWGSGNTVQNCLVEHIDRSLTDAACVNVTGTGHRIVHNTLRTAARSILVHRRLSAGEVAYNDMGEGGCALNDLGITYTFHADGAGTRIHHNWIHDNLASVGAAFNPGLYFDNDSPNHAVDHNVVWNCGLGVFANDGSTRLGIRDNTMWNVPVAVSARSPGSAVSGNLAAFGPFDGGAPGANRTYDRVCPPFVDPERGDFRPVPGAPPGGACEAGAAWTAGAAMASPPFSDLRPANPDRLTAAPAEWGRAIQLAWRSRSRDEAGFRVYRGDDASAFAPIASLPAGATGYRDAAVRPGTRYRYRVAAVNAAGESAGSGRAVAETVSDGGVLRLQAVEADNRSGTAVMGDFIGGCYGGDYLEFDNVDLRSGYTGWRILAASPLAKPGMGLEIRLDGLDGPQLCAITPENTGAWSRFRERAVSLAAPTEGIHNLYVVCVGGAGVGNFKWFQLEGGKPGGSGGLFERTLAARDATGAAGAANGMAFRDVNLGLGAKALSLGLADAAPGISLDVRLDDPIAGTLLGSLAPLPAGGGSAGRTETAALSGGSGIHTVYLVPRKGGRTADVRWIKLAIEAPPERVASH